MATKTKTASKKKAPAKKPVSTPVRHTEVPKAVAAKPAVVKKTFSRDDVALKAYFISLTSEGGSETDNWLKAEAELASL